MQEPVQDGVGQGGFADVFMPVIDRELAGDQCGPPIVAIFDDLHQVVALRVGQRLYTRVVEDQQIGFEQLAHQAYVRAVAVGDAQLLEQGRQAQVAYRQPLTARLIAECTGNPGLAAAGRAGEAEVQ